MPSYSEYAVSLYRALKDDPFYACLERSIIDCADRQQAMLAYFRMSMLDAERWGRLTLSEGGAFGAALWSLPLTVEEAAQRKQQRRDALGEALGAQGASTYDKMEASIEAREAQMDLGGFWYLSILGVAPDRQGRGLGAKLLAPVLQEADAAGATSFLTTFSPGNIGFYEAVGFERAAQFSDEVVGAAFSVLIRRARV